MKIGVFVRFVGGGPVMAVVENTDPILHRNYVTCGWFDVDSVFHKEVFQKEVLTLESTE